MVNPVGRPRNPVVPRKPNPLTNLPTIRHPTPIHIRAVQNAKKARRPACPNKKCMNPKIEDGICTNCGAVADDANIVNEVQFGENSSGAAVVQGSFVSADQGAAKSLGPAFRRAGGSDGKEKTEREGKRIMQGFAGEHKLSEAAVNSGFQIFKMCTMYNFIQGRRINQVAAVCLYTACRKERPCRVMLIDFADSCQCNVFKLGHVFKKLHATIPISSDGMEPVIAEDLIYRFATKLDFGPETEKVALSAVRLVNRMSKDWMQMGRRPSGICGACLILAARMHNFRRTVTEVVYVVKVTTQTIQRRLEEFSFTPSGNLTIEDFLGNDFLESAHDPPSFYQKTEEYQALRKKNRRRRVLLVGEEYNGVIGDGVREVTVGTEIGDEGSVAPEPTNKRTRNSASVEDDTGAEHVDKRQKPNDALPTPPSTQSQLSSDSALMPPPPRPTHITSVGSSDTPTPAIIDPALLEDTENDEALESMARAHGDAPTPPENVPAGSEPTTSIKTTSPAPKRGRGRPPKNPPAIIPSPVDQAWLADEAQLAHDIEDMIDDPVLHDPAIASQISEVMNDPSTDEHAHRFNNASVAARHHMSAFNASRSEVSIPMTSEVEEDEFADDYEVQNCLLSPEEALAKETLWVNNNKDWLRDQQQKEWKKKMAALGPPKATRNRQKKKRMGEGQESAASSPAEAAGAVMKNRAFSKRINYEAITSLFGDAGSVGTSSMASSRGTSRAGSVVSDAGPGSRAGSVAPVLASVAARERMGNVTESGGGAVGEDAADDDDAASVGGSDYNEPDDVPDPDADWRAAFDAPEAATDEFGME